MSLAHYNRITHICIRTRTTAVIEI